MSCRPADLSVVEYTVLDALSRQDGWHMRMQQLARRGALAQRDHPAGEPAGGPRAAHTDPVQEDRRGIYTELTETGRELLASARPTHDEALSAALEQARQTPELAELADSLHGVPRRTPASVGS